MYLMQVVRRKIDNQRKFSSSTRAYSHGMLKPILWHPNIAIEIGNLNLGSHPLHPRIHRARRTRTLRTQGVTESAIRGHSLGSAIDQLNQVN